MDKRYKIHKQTEDGAFSELLTARELTMVKVTKTCKASPDEENPIALSRDYALKYTGKEVQLSRSQEKIAEIVDATKDLLLYKNKMYGDSALNPVGIFTKHLKSVPENTASILVRLDDKLGRVRNADTLRTNDVSDIIGYCTLLLVSMGVTKEDIAKFKD